MALFDHGRSINDKIETEWLDWHRCYDDGYRGLIVDDAFAHPAKAARGLIRRIFAHMEAQGWLPPRSRVLDVFGGIGTTAIEGASRGHEVVCIELEEKFYKLALENFQLHRRTWEEMGDPMPVMMLGDSRKAVELVRGHFAGCVGSPPFCGSLNDGANHARMHERYPGWGKNAGGSNRMAKSVGENYGQSPGQLGAMPEGDVTAAIGSPPFLDARQDTTPSIKGKTAPTAHDPENWSGDVAITAPESNSKSIDRTKQYETYRKSGGGASFEAFCATQQFHSGGYGSSDGQLGLLKEGSVEAVISSPPYAETPITGQGNFQSAKCPDAQPARDLRRSDEGYDAVVGSPPYADSVNSEKSGIDWNKVSEERSGGPPKTVNSQGVTPFRYGESEGQLGALKEGEIDAVISSPPYAESIKGEHGERETAKESHEARTDKGQGGPLGRSQRHGGYGGKDNLGNLPEGDVDGVVSSPPFEQSLSLDRPNAEERRKVARERGVSAGNIGNQSGETFWAASRTILEQVHALLKPGGYCAWIVKDYVKAGKRVPFCDNWARLCEAVGFKVIQRVRCHLVKEETNPGLFGDVTKKTERKSFFRRLHERKPGAVRIDWEEVVFVVKEAHL